MMLRQFIQGGGNRIVKEFLIILGKSMKPDDLIENSYTRGRRRH